MTTIDQVLDSLAKLGDPDCICVGDLVEPIPPKQLVCGSGWYPYAVCVKVDPFILISINGDMLWSHTVEKKDFKVCGRVDKDILSKVNKRIRQTEHHLKEI